MHDDHDRCVLIAGGKEYDARVYLDHTDLYDGELFLGTIERGTPAGERLRRVIFSMDIEAAGVLAEVVLLLGKTEGAHDL